MDVWGACASALFGACVQEVGHWYDLRGQLSSKTYTLLLQSKAYWLITAAMIMCSVVGVVLWKLNNLTSYTPFDLAVFGAAFPVLFKKAVSGASGNQVRRLGQERWSNIRYYFLLERKDQPT